MTDYLFQGKRLDNGEMVTGSLLTFADDDRFICRDVSGVMEKYPVEPESVELLDEGDVAPVLKKRVPSEQVRAAFSEQFSRRLDYKGDPAGQAGPRYFQDDVPLETRVKVYLSEAAPNVVYGRDGAYICMEKLQYEECLRMLTALEEERDEARKKEIPRHRGSNG